MTCIVICCCLYPWCNISNVNKIWKNTCLKKKVHILKVSNIMFMFTVKQQHSSQKVGHIWTENDEKKIELLSYVCLYLRQRTITYFKTELLDFWWSLLSSSSAVLFFFFFIEVVHQFGGGVWRNVYVTIFKFPATWAATFHLQALAQCALYFCVSKQRHDYQRLRFLTHKC